MFSLLSTISNIMYNVTCLVYDRCYFPSPPQLFFLHLEIHSKNVAQRAWKTLQLYKNTYGIWSSAAPSFSATRAAISTFRSAYLVSVCRRGEEINMNHNNSKAEVCSSYFNTDESLDSTNWPNCGGTRHDRVKRPHAGIQAWERNPRITEAKPITTNSVQITPHLRGLLDLKGDESTTW